MMSTKTSVLLQVLCTLLSVQAYADDVRSESQESAKKALITFRKIARTDKFLLSSQADVESAQLGDPLAVFMVQLDRLKAYTGGTDPNKLLIPLQKVIYPVIARNEPQTTITMEKTGATWKPVSFGDNELIRRISAARKEAAAKNGLGVDVFFLVEVPALARSFIGCHLHEKLMLTPLAPDEELKLSAGESLPADEVFVRMVPLAQSHNDLPD